MGTPRSSDRLPVSRELESLPLRRTGSVARSARPVSAPPPSPLSLEQERLGCVAQHWYELRLEGKEIGEDNQRRLVSLTSLERWHARHGLDAVHGKILSAVKGESAPEVSFVLAGAYYFSNEKVIEAFVLKNLESGSLEYRIAATYAALFFFERNQDAPFLLSVRALSGEEEKNVVQASREALSIWSDARSGGKCRLCWRTGGSVSTPRPRALTVQRASSR